MKRHTSRKEMTINRRDFLRLTALGSAGVLTGFPAVARPWARRPLANPKWPTTEWPISTPEAQGIDSAELTKYFEYLISGRYSVKSMVVIRHGHIVAEVYSERTPQDQPVGLDCATKGFINALVGIALADGLIESVDEPVLSFFTDRTFDNMDAQKEALTVKDVLTANTGLAWDWRTDRSGILRSDDWVQYMLDKPVGELKGTGVLAHAYLASAIVQSAAQSANGDDTLTLARERLFAPLGISDVTWDLSPEGVPSHVGLHLTLRDMAKWGYLYLNQGIWEEQPLLPAEWIAESTVDQIPADFDTQTNHFYLGYLLHVYKFGGYAAQGTDFAGGGGTAAIVVMPELDLMVAFNVVKRMNGCELVRTLCQELMPATVSTEPLPDNPAAQAELQDTLDTIAQA